MTWCIQRTEMTNTLEKELASLREELKSKTEREEELTAELNKKNNIMGKAKKGIANLKQELTMTK